MPQDWSGSPSGDAVLIRSFSPKRYGFGPYLRALREDKQMSLRQFAREIPLSPAYQSNIEHEIMPPPSVTILCRMAEILGIPENTLLARAGKLKPTILHSFWKHPAIPPILSTIPGMSLADAQMVCEQMIISFADDPPPQEVSHTAGTPT